MQLIPKTNNHLHVELDSAFEIFLYNHCDDIVEFIRLHLGVPNAIFNRHISSNSSVILDFDLQYNYLEDLSKIKRNLNISDYASKIIIGTVAA